jgi:hypothetical protein
MPKKVKEEDAMETADQAEWKMLTAEADRLHRLTNKEEHDFNEFQQQREKLNYFWIVEKKKLEDKRAELRNKERELQDLEEKHQVEIKIYKQRLKHLLHEQQKEITVKKTETEMAVKMRQDDDRDAESDIKEDRRMLQIAIKEIDQNQGEFLRALKREQDQKATTLRHDFERRANEIQKAYDARMKKNRAALDKIRTEEIKQIEDKKAEMIELLMAEHQKAFVDIKNYYYDVTRGNLDFITRNKTEVKALENQEYVEQNKLNEVKLENKKLLAPLKRMEETYNRLVAEKESYDKEKLDKESVKEKLAKEEAALNNHNWEYETLLQRFEILKKERDELKQNLYSSIFDVKQKSCFRGILLEKKLVAMQRVHEEREAQLNEVLARANLEPGVLSQVKGHVDDVLLRKNREAQYLQAEIARMKMKHQRLVDVIGNKMRAYGLSVAELGFTAALGTGTGSELRASQSMGSMSSTSGPARASEPVY